MVQRDVSRRVEQLQIGGNLPFLAAEGIGFSKVRRLFIINHVMVLLRIVQPIVIDFSQHVNAVVFIKQSIGIGYDGKHGNAVVGQPHEIGVGRDLAFVSRGVHCHGANDIAFVHQKIGGSLASSLSITSFLALHTLGSPLRFSMRRGPV